VEAETTSGDATFPMAAAATSLKGKKDEKKRSIGKRKRTYFPKYTPGLCPWTTTQ
jgi:hypothetical protein